MLGFIIGLIVTIIVGTMIVKKVKPQTSLILGGFILLYAALIIGAGPLFEEGKGTGLQWFDVFEMLKNTFTKTTSGLGMSIMAVGGFAKYMEHIGASKALVHVAVKPLRKMKHPYLLLSVGYIIGQALNIFIPSASGLGVLLMVTMYPILVGLGVSKLAAAAMIGTSACLDLGPASGNSNLAAETSGLGAAEYFAKFQMPVAVVTVIVIAVLHYIVNTRWDKKDGIYMSGNAAELSEETAEEEAHIPGIYAVLPLLPLILILMFSNLFIKGIKMNVVTAMLIAMVVSMLAELLRIKDAKKVADSIQVFFKGMGNQFAGVVTLVIAGQIFADGLTKVGFIDFVIGGAQSANLGVVPMTLIMVAVIALAAIIMGSGNAPFFAFASLAPGVAESLGVPTVLMAMPMQLTAGIARSMSPITAVIIAVAGIAGVDTVDTVKRTFIPMLGGLIAMVATTFILF